MKQTFFLVSIIFSISVLGQNQSDWSAKQRQLFEFIELPQYPGMPLLTSEIEKFQVALSLEVLNRMNSATAQDMKCMLVDLVPDKNISVYHLDIISEMLNRYEYHESGYTPCEATKDVLNSKELSKIKSALWSDSILKNEYPSGHCRGRAFLTSKKLDDLGFKSKILTLKGNIFATYKTGTGFRSASYLDHVVNVVKVKENNQTTEYVLDPMFTEEPIPLEQYLEMTSLPIYGVNKHEFKHQSYADKLAPPLQDEVCQYNINLLNDYETTIRESLKKPISLNQGPSKIYVNHEEAKKDQNQIILNFKVE